MITSVLTDHLRTQVLTYNILGSKGEDYFTGARYLHSRQVEDWALTL